MTPRVTEVGALVLFSARIADAVAFYRTLGIALEDERHEDGPLHFACELGDLHFALYESAPGSAPPRRLGGCTFPGFVVDSVAASLEAVRALGASVLQEPEEYPWGLRCVVEDPDGRPIEIYERAA